MKLYWDDDDDDGGILSGNIFCPAFGSHYTTLE